MQFEQLSSSTIPLKSHLRIRYLKLLSSMTLKLNDVLFEGDSSLVLESFLGLFLCLGTQDKFMHY